MRFQLKSIDTKSNARTGEITINNNIIKTPVFMPVGTLGNVKGIMQNLLEEDSKAEIILNKFIEQVKKNYNILSSKIVLCGFSQGCMMAINIALTNREKFNCVVGFSGKIIDKDDLEKRKKNSPETLLIHGDADEVVPVSNILEAKDFLIRNNVSVNTKIIKNCGHHIPIEASSLALHFIKKNLEIK